MLHLTGQIDSPFLGQGRGVIHETKDQLGMLAAVSKDASTIGSAAQVVTTLAEAAALALAAPRGPVSVEIPIDVQYEGIAAGFAPACQRCPSPPDPTAVGAAVKLITASKRPLVWLGGGATGAGKEVTALVDKLAAGVLTSNAGRGILREDRPNVVGNFAAHPDAADLIDGADLLVSIGTHFRSNETKHYQLALPRPHVQIDVDPAAIGRAYPVDVSIVGDARLVVTALLEALGDVDTDPTWMGIIREARERARDTLRRAIGPYAVLCEAMRGAFDETSPLVRDITIPATSWGNRLLPIYEATTNIYARGGGIGQGLGMSIGAAAARPEVPTALMVGDGGLAVHLGELGTVADEQPWLVMIVFNDGGYGVLRNLQDRHFGRRAGVDLATPNFESLAGAYSLDYRRIESPDQAVEVLDKAVATRAPVVVEVDCDSIRADARTLRPAGANAMSIAMTGLDQAMPDGRLLIGGEWRSGTGAAIESINPFDGSINRTFTGASSDDVDEAVNRGRAAMDNPAWRDLLPHQRARYLHGIADLIDAGADRIAAIQTADTGKTLTETTALARSAAGTFRYFAAVLEVAEDALTPSRGDYLTMSVHEPLGVIAAITPWNSPIASDAQKVAPSIGCRERRRGQARVVGSPRRTRTRTYRKGGSTSGRPALGPTGLGSRGR